MKQQFLTWFFSFIMGIVGIIMALTVFSSLIDTSVEATAIFVFIFLAVIALIFVYYKVENKWTVCLGIVSAAIFILGMMVLIAGRMH